MITVVRRPIYEPDSTEFRNTYDEPPRAWFVTITSTTGAFQAQIIRAEKLADACKLAEQRSMVGGVYQIAGRLL